MVALSPSHGEMSKKEREETEKKRRIAMAALVTQWDGALTFLSPVASLPPTTSRHATPRHAFRRNHHHHQQQQQQQHSETIRSTTCFHSIPSKFGRLGFSNSFLGLSKSDATATRLKFDIAVWDWRASICEDEAAIPVPSEVQSGSVDENPNLANEEDCLEAVNGVEGQIGGVEKQKSESLNGTISNVVQARVGGIEQQELESLNGANSKGAETPIDGMEQQKSEPLNGANSNGVEALDSSIEQQNSESSNDGMEQQNSESLNGANSNGVEALDSSIEQLNSESSNAGTSSHVATQMDKCKEVLWLFKDRKIKEAIGLLGSISHLDEWVVSTYVELLQDCGKVKAVTEGKELHALALKHGFLSNGFIASTLISTYCKLGMVPEAQKIFDGMRTRSALSWNALISGYAKHGYHKEAVRLYHSMKEEGFQLDSVTYILMLNSCASKGDIQLGKQIHADARKYDYECKLWVSTALLNMYVKCGDLEDARRVFDNMTNRNVISWTSMISGYAKSGNGLEALNLYQQMKRAGVKATEITFLFLLKACASLAEIEQGKQIHADLIKSGLSLNAFLGTALIDMYSKCGDMGKAQEVFDKIPTPNVVSFAAMISGHCKNGNNKEAIRCYMQMKQQGFRPNGVTIASVLHACANAESLEEGQQIHADAVRYGFSSDVRVTAALVNMYSQCHRLQVARELFNRMSHQSVVSWTAMIAAYAKNAAGEEAFKLYDQMKKENIKPDANTFVFVLHACATTRNLEMGKQIHAEVLEAGLESHIAVGSALVDMYSKCGSLADSRLVFDRMPTKNISTWTSMIAGYVKHENSEEAFQLYRQMKLEGLKPDAWVFVCVLNACVQIGSLEYGKEVHEDIRKAGYETDATVKNSLSIMYSKCESPEARQAQQALQQA